MKKILLLLLLIPMLSIAKPKKAKRHTVVKKSERKNYSKREIDWYYEKINQFKNKN